MENMKESPHKSLNNQTLIDKSNTNSHHHRTVLLTEYEANQIRFVMNPSPTDSCWRDLLEDRIDDANDVLVLSDTEAFELKDALSKLREYTVLTEREEMLYTKLCEFAKGE